MPRPVLIDTNAGTENVGALLLALWAMERGEIDIVGITCVHGNLGIDDATLNAYRILKLFDRHADVPIFVGATSPLLRPIQTGEFPGGFRGRNALRACEAVEPTASEAEARCFVNRVE